MTKSVFSLQRLTASKKTMRAAAALAMWSLTTPVYSGGLTNFVKDVTERTTVYVFAEHSDASLLPAQETRRGVAAIVYSPSAYKRGKKTESAFQVAQVSNVLDGQFFVADLTPTRDYTLLAADDGENKILGLSSGAWIGTTIVLVAVGLTAWMTNDDGNRDGLPASGN